jgi:hypothetical protein
MEKPKITTKLQYMKDNPDRKYIATLVISLHLTILRSQDLRSNIPRSPAPRIQETLILNKLRQPQINNDNFNILFRLFPYHDIL